MGSFVQGGYAVINWFQAVKHQIEVDSVAPPPDPPEAVIREGAGVQRSAFLGGARANMTDALAVAGSTYGIAVVEPLSAEGATLIHGG
jgi:hypothetical protein